MALDLTTLLPILKPVGKEIFDAVITPLLQSEAAKISNPEVDAFVLAVLPALEAEIDKLLT